MKHFLKYLFFAYLAMAAQSSLFRSVKPDIVLVLVCFYSVRYGPLRGAAYGALTGFVLDAAAGVMLGPHMIGMAFTAYLAGIIRENVFHWNVIVSTIMITVMSVIDIVLVYACMETFSGLSFANRPLSVPALEVVLTFIAGLALYPVFHKEDRNGLLT